MGINDTRTDEEKTSHVWLVVATDKFMSGWGMAKYTSSYFAIACKDADQAYIAEQKLRDRPEMINIRHVKDNGRYRPKGHLSISTFENTWCAK